MGWGYHNRCRACRHEWEVISYSEHIGRRFHASYAESRNAFRKWYCPRCYISLFLPREADRNSWIKWRASREGTIDLAPYLERIAAKIDACLAGVRAHTPIPLDLVPGECPGCSKPFEEIIDDDFPLECPLCGVRGDEVAVQDMGHYIVRLEEDFLKLEDRVFD